VKDNNFKELAAHISAEDKVYVIGEASSKILDQLKEFAPIDCGNLETAVMKAFEEAHPGDAVLLSPACASYDQYNNFEERGDHFKKLIKSISDKKKFKDAMLDTDENFILLRNK
jgi:UDP-N-acetylmuramoylalanine--D-glutamate ligase